MESLPPELAHRIAFDTGVLAPRDVLNLVLASPLVAERICGDEYARAVWKGMMGAEWCVARRAWMAARMAVVHHRECAAWAPVRTSELLNSVLNVPAEALGASSSDAHRQWLALALELVRMPDLVPVLDFGEWHCAILATAAARGHPEAVAALLLHPSVAPQACHSEAIVTAARYGRLACVQLLLADGRADPNEPSDPPLSNAITCGHAAVAELLAADPRVDVGVGGHAALFFAARRGHTALLELLIGPRSVDPSVSANRALVLASMNGHADAVAALLAHPRSDPSLSLRHAHRLASRASAHAVLAILDPLLDALNHASDAS